MKMSIIFCTLCLKNVLVSTNQCFGFHQQTKFAQKKNPTYVLYIDPIRMTFVKHDLHCLHCKFLIWFCEFCAILRYITGREKPSLELPYEYLTKHVRQLCNTHIIHQKTEYWINWQRRQKDGFFLCGKSRLSFTYHLAETNRTDLLVDQISFGRHIV